MAINFYENETTGTMSLKLGGIEISDCVIDKYEETWETENSEEFRIGCFPARELKFGLDMNLFRSKFTGQPPLDGEWVLEWIVRHLEGEDFIETTIKGGTFILAELDEDYDKRANVTLYDRAILADVPYNFTKLDYDTGTTTVAQVLEIAMHLGYDIEGIEFIKSKPVQWYDGILSVRAHIEYIAELSGCNVFMTHDNKLRFSPVKPSSPQVSLPLEFVIDDYQEGDTVTFTRTLWNNGLVEYIGGDDSGSTLFVSSNNPYVDTQADIDYIHSVVGGLRITNVPNLKAFGNPEMNLFDCVRLTDDGVERAVIFVNAMTLRFSQAFGQNLTANIQSENYERVAQIYGNADIRRMQVIVDNNKQQIEISFEKQDQYQAYIDKFIRFIDGQIQLGERLDETNTQPFTYMTVIGNEGMSIGKVDRESGSFEETALFKYDKMLITKAEITQSLQLGNVAFYREPNGSVSLKKAITQIGGF